MKRLLPAGLALAAGAATLVYLQAGSAATLQAESNVGRADLACTGDFVNGGQLDCTISNLELSSTSVPSTSSSVPSESTSIPPSSTESPTTSSPPSSSSSTPPPSTISSTTEAPTTTMPAMHEACPGIPDVTPVGALPPALPMLCDHLTTGVAPTFISGPNSWVDDFQHGASMTDIGPGYQVFDSVGSVRSGHFRHNQHWMVDVYGPGEVGGGMMRPDRTFRFENGKLVVEGEVAAGIDDYFDMWPEITVTTASSPANSPRGRVGPTPGVHVDDQLYAYGYFGGQWSVGIRLTGNRPTAAFYDNTQRGFSCGRIWEISWFQNGTASCGNPANQFSTFGGGEWVQPGVRHCQGTDPDTNCRDLFRWELSQSKITLYVNGTKYMEHTAAPGYKALPDEFVNSPVYVYFSDWVFQPQPNKVIRYHWDHLAVNP